MMAGAFFALLLAVVCIRFKANEVVAGTGINILFLGLPAVLSAALFLSSGSTPQIPQEELLPTLSQLLPIAPRWRVLTDVSVISFLAMLVVGLTSYVLYWTPFGLRLRSVGENPEAADAAGIRVIRIRYTGVILSGVLAGVAGAYLSIGQSSLFTRNMTAGRGFIALAALIFGKWRPVQTMLACVLFGFADALTIQMQGVVKLPSGEDVPVQFIQMIPYLVTIVVLAGFIGQSRAPGALGVPYEKES
jgi:simple sugar transport system permease protein